MITQKTLEKRIAKVMEMTEELKLLVIEETEPFAKARILIGNHQIMVQHVLMGWSRI